MKTITPLAIELRQREQAAAKDKHLQACYDSLDRMDRTVGRLRVQRDRAWAVTVVACACSLALGLGAVSAWLLA